MIWPPDTCRPQEHKYVTAFSWCFVKFCSFEASVTCCHQLIQLHLSNFPVIYHEATRGNLGRRLRLESNSNLWMAENWVQLVWFQLPVGWHCTYYLQFSIEAAAGEIKTGKITPWFQEGYWEHTNSAFSLLPINLFFIKKNSVCIKNCVADEFAWEK